MAVPASARRGLARLEPSAGANRGAPLSSGVGGSIGSNSDSRSRAGTGGSAADRSQDLNWRIDSRRQAALHAAGP